MIDSLDLQAYADGELSPEDTARVAAEISSSPAAAEQLENLRRFKACLQTKMVQHDTTALWKSCRGRLDELDRVKKAEYFVGKYAWGLACLLFFVILGGGLFTRMHGGTVGLSTVAGYSSELFPMSTGSAANIQQLHLDPNRLQVLAVYYSDQPLGRVFRYTLRDQDGPLVLVTIPNIASVEGVRSIGDNMYAGEINNHQCVTWHDDNRQMFLIGDRDPEQLKDVVQSHL